ncbi:MAG: hypothetical protein HKP17_09175 [Ignavibacteriaceae bacterium]|nr:hypothetical protein [Ignavibacteriaceae bacterium]
MMQLNQNGNATRDISNFGGYIKTGGNRFSQLAKFVIGISIFLGLLMLTIR